MGEMAEEAIGLLLNLCQLLFLRKPCSGFDCAGGKVTQDAARRGSRLVLCALHAHLCTYLCAYLCTHMPFFFFTWTPGCDGLCLGLKDGQVLWSLGGIPEFAIELARKSRIGLESKADGKS